MAPTLELQSGDICWKPKKICKDLKKRKEKDGFDAHPKADLDRPKQMRLFYQLIDFGLIKSISMRPQDI